jgi:hypothetical protein
MSLEKTSETFSPDNLFAGHVQPVVAQEGILAQDQGVLVRGTVLGQLTADGTLVMVDKDIPEVESEPAPTGAEKVYAILAETTDTTGDDRPAPVYLTGEFNERALVFKADNDADDHRESARNVGIFFKDTVPA